MKRIVLGVLFGALLVSAAPQDDKGRIQQRQENQQDRIGNGVKNGSLTAGETAHLEKKESNLSKEVRADRRQNGGNLTNNEKRQINRQQNRLSKQIYKDKHNGKTQPN